MEFRIDDKFYLDGKEVKIISGAIHYFRSLPESWEDKIIKLKAMGANCVETCIAWNLHEPYEGKWTFEGHLNLPYFIELATKHDLMIMVRFGPYMCGEHDYGAFPWWLNNKKDIKFRCDNEVFLEETRKYTNKMVEILAPYCASNGGNIILCQLENEYGSYGNDKAYLKKLLNIIREAGFKDDIITSDGSWHTMLEGGTLLDEGILPTVNFGSKANEHFDVLEKFIGKDKPLMCMEYWCGWFNAWKSEKIITTDPKVAAVELDEILKRGSVNIYMFHGGTNWGAQAGANQSIENGYTPDITSYDYDALLDERGNITQKYRECKKVISKYVDIPEIEITNIPSTTYLDINYIGSANIFGNDSFEKINKAHPLTMESLGFGFGYVLYETCLDYLEKINSIQLKGMNDRALVFLDEKLVLEVFKEEHKMFKLDKKIRKKTKLSILVENTGRVNYGPMMENQVKGIDGGVFINNHFFQFGWDNIKLPLEYKLFEGLTYNKKILNKPQIHKYNMCIDKSENIYDTFLNMEEFGKGYVYVNGFNIGRFWQVGPQYKLFLPSQLLKYGANEILIIESDGIVGNLKSEK
ncbi:MAG: glycoside hydrolase family 35 protein [Bacilli bacterium]